MTLLGTNQIIGRDYLARLQRAGHQTPLEGLGIGKTKQKETRQVPLFGFGKGLPAQIFGMDERAGLHPMGGNQHLGHPIRR